MPSYGNIGLTQQEDGTVRVGVAPPTSIGGWSMEFNLYLRFGGDPILTHSVSSGYSGASGLTVVDSGNGIVQTPIATALSLSGYNFGNYPFRLSRTDSGYRANIREGYLIYTP